MMYLYDQNELNFSRNGKTIQNAFNAKVVHYLNSEYTLTFSVLMNDEIAKDLEINKIVFAENQPFRITTIQPSLKEFKVYARHVFFDLLDYQVENVNVNSVTGQTVMNAIFSSNNTNFTYTSDITKRSTMNDSKKNIVEMLARAIERFEGELKRDKFSVALNNSVGKDTNYVVYPNKNISSSVKETDVTNVCTRVIVEYGEYEDIKQVIVVSENVDLYPQAKTKRYQNLDLKTEADAIAWGKGKFQGINRIDVPKVSIEIDLSLDRELSGLEIGDTLICKIPTLKLDERIQIIGYEFDPNTNLRTKIFAGFKAKGLSGTINNSVVEAIRPEISDVDDKLQQQINEANEAIQKEYEERIESVNDAIAKAEAEAEVMKKEIQDEISQAVTDWNTEFEEAKTNIDNSIGNVSKELGEYIESTDEIIERVNSDLSDLFTGVEANNGAITTITTEQGVLSAKVGEVVVTADSALSKATEAQITADGFSTRVGSLETSDSTQNSNISSLQQTASGLTSTVSSHTSSINGLNSTVSTHTSEIKQTSDKISMVVSDGSTASAVQLTPNALTAIAKDINLKGNVTFNSLVEGDGTNTQILGGKIKTNSISANKLIVGNSQSLVRLTKGENSTGLDWVQNTGGTPFWVTKYVYSNYENRMVCILGDHISTRSLGLNGKSVQFSLSLTVFEGVKNRFAVQIFVYNDDGSGNPHCTTDWISPLWTQQTVKTQQYLTVPMTASHIMIRLIQEPYGDLTSQNPQHGVGSFSVTPMNAGELIVDGAIKANHIVSGSAELGAVTSKVLSTEALNAAWANIGNAFINKLTSDDALFQRLTAKSAWITSANIVSLEASRIKGGTLQSTNGAFNQNLNTGVTTYTASGANSQINMGTYYGATGLHLISGVANSGALMFLATNGLGYFNTDTASFGRSGQHSGFKVVTNAYDKSDIATTNPAACRIIPWTAGTGSVGQGDYPIFEVRAKTITDVLSTFNLPTTFSSNESFTSSSALNVVDSCPVTEFFFGDTLTNTFNFDDDTPENAVIGIDFTKLRRLKTSDTSLLFTEQGEMTLNTEIAILWKAVQELSEQNKKLQEQINLLK